MVKHPLILYTFEPTNCGAPDRLPFIVPTYSVSRGRDADGLHSVIFPVLLWVPHEFSLLRHPEHGATPPQRSSLALTACFTVVSAVQSGDKLVHVSSPTALHDQDTGSSDGSLRPVRAVSAAYADSNVNKWDVTTLEAEMEHSPEQHPYQESEYISLARVQIDAYRQLCNVARDSTPLLKSTSYDIVDGPIAHMPCNEQD